MPRSEHLLRPAYWFGDVDPRPLGLFRIGLGLTVLHDLANYATNLRAFATDDGFLPRGVQGEPRAWPLFERLGSDAAVYAVFALGVVAVVAFTVGFRARVAAIVSWVFLTCLHTRNLFVTDGGDDLVRCLTFLSIFADTGAAYGVESWGAKRKQEVPSIGLRFLQLHIVLLYFCAARLKFRAHWLTVNVIYQCLQLDGFVRPPGKWLMASPTMCLGLGIATLVFEWCFAFLALSPWRLHWCRLLAIACGVAVQGGILVTMRVGIFTETMLIAMLLFVQPEWLDGTWPWSPGARTSERALTAKPAEPWSPAKVPRARLATFALLGAYFASLAWGPFIGRRVPRPAVVGLFETRLWLDQPFGLFDVVYDLPRWEARGEKPSGETVDVLPVAAPGLVPNVGWSFSRWYKFTFKELERPYPMPSIASFFCREYARKTREPLASIMIAEHFTPPEIPGQARRPERVRERFRGACPARSP